ncbi:tryptophan--tRNA ligase [Helicobacter kayseriensis]|uniref:tryptophan--tRNA ligase n=1 Tax=Helicobacter kayseriensis TaxID=2905877 RepID=UPI001E3B1E7A|nr:tryptophan--tRNA ligase [Helicobacter kayseriensis]MCE3047505.1 tryptophan--tRNA ligase [Helicobacter kayseriensis]MCE3048762.1 tryptophan--tRNA ligase [Helicobacter kayseriensis]
MKQRVFSGIQPTGKITIGNYLGAVKNWVYLQEKYDSIFCVVNSHAITTKQDPYLLREQTYDMVAILLACGIDPKHSSLFIQSEIDTHPALSWILNCNIPMGEMERMTQFKDKAQKNPKNINVGLFDYPALMASDILLYQTDLVPVGEDQKQHLELTRNVAQRFNRDFGECFKIPEPLIAKSGARIMGLDDPTSKMSKSSTAQNHAIFLLDTPKEIEQKIKKATTDSHSSIVFDPDRKGVYNLLCIYELFTQKSREEIETEFIDQGYGVLKKRIAEAIISTLSPIQEEYLKIRHQIDYLAEVLNQGREKVQPIAESTYKKAKELVGLI